MPFAVRRTGAADMRVRPVRPVLQQVLDYTPVRTGLAFLPMPAAIMAASALANNLLIPRVGPRPVLPAGMGIAAAGTMWLTALGLHSEYTAHVLPSLLTIGSGLGCVMAPAMNMATYGVVAHDAGVASAMFNTMQQVGGSIGTSLFNTPATGTSADYLSGRDARGAAVRARAAIEGCDTAYMWAAAFLVAGLVLSALLYRSGPPDRAAVAAGAVAAGAGEGSASADGRT